MTQEELAEHIGVKQGTVSKWMSGAHLPVGLAKRALEKDHPKLYKQIQAIYKERNERK